jgi:hypothetical protein
MYERHIVLPPSGQGPGVLQTKDKTLKPKNQGHNTIKTSIEKHRSCYGIVLSKEKSKSKNQRNNTIIPLTEKRQSKYSIILSKDKPHKLSCLLRCADKHIACVKTKDKGQKPNHQTLRASQLFTVCDTSALACWQYTPDEIVLVCLFKCISLLRCAYKHKNIEIQKTKDKSVRVNSESPFGCSRLLSSSLRVPLLYCIGACFAAHRNTKTLSSKAQTHKRQNPVEIKCRGRARQCSVSHLLWL